MTTLEERAPAGFFLTPTDRETLHDLLAKAERISTELADAYRAAQRIVTGTTDLDEVHVDLGLAEQGVAHQQAFPPCGAGLRSETVTADELLLGDRAVPVEHMVVGPEKDAFRHFHRIDGVSAPHGGQVVLGWGGEDRVVACDWPFARISTGRVVVETEDGPEAYYEWEAGR